MKKIPLQTLNEIMTAPGAFARADKEYVQKLEQIAADIQKNRLEKPILLLSGPSGAGKTTSAYLIERFLDRAGIETHTISMDNFFCTMTPLQRQQAADGTLDLESPNRVDVPYMNEILRQIVAGEPVWMPKYHFSTTTRDDRGWRLTRKPGELLILEGIHALNPHLIQIPDNQTLRLYVSVRTRITCGDILLHPSRLRLLRRMIRDRNFRQRELPETLEMFERVQHGEKQYITPYKARATHSLDTFLPYELGVYKTILQTALQSCAGSPLLCELLRIWDDITPLSPEQVPPDSLVREFIGGSSFRY